MPPALGTVLNDNRKGRKNGRGFYLYPQKGRKKQVDSPIYRLLNITPKHHIDTQNISQRCVMMVLDEAARTLEKQVIASARDSDIGAVFGIGFPPFLGGPFHYIAQLGIG